MSDEVQFKSGETLKITEFSHIAFCKFSYRYYFRPYATILLNEINKRE